MIDYKVSQVSPLGLDPVDVARTLEPVERATMLPPAAFADPAVFEWELETLFGGWVCAGHAGMLAEPGSYLVRQLGATSVALIAGSDGVPRAFLNACRHRGSRLLAESDEGSVRRRIRCPYHAWSYDLDGSLRAAPHMNGVEDFEPGCWGLIPVRTALVGGLVWIDLSGEAPPISEHLGELATHLDRYRSGELRRGGRRDYEPAANWKGIAENYSECLHCPGIHPELDAISAYDSGESMHGPGAWCGGSMTIREGSATMGRHAAAPPRPPISGLEPSDHGQVLYFVAFPNALVSLHPDYVMLHTLWPRACDRTEIVCEWYFEPETIGSPGFDPSDAIEFWDQVNREDWRVCELAQLGVASRGYLPGRYSVAEYDVHAFDRMVAERYADALGSGLAA